jgi:hypothetical protein
MSRRFTREVQKPLGIVVQSKQEKPCGARPLRVEKGGRPNISPAFLFVGHPLWRLRARSPKDDVADGSRSLVAIAEMDGARGWRRSPRQ